jgi:acetyl-CoA acetyltransferase family protein
LTKAGRGVSLVEDAAWIVEGLRTPMAEYCGAFADVSANHLGAAAIAAVLERTGAEPGQVDQVVLGNALQTSPDAAYGARHAALHAGLPAEVPALTVNRLCGSGIESILEACRLLLLGEADAVVAGGMENMTQAPHAIRGARLGFRLGQGALEDTLVSALHDTACGLSMAETAERLASERGIWRGEQDVFARRSQRAAAEAAAAGRLTDEIVPVPVGEGRRRRVVEADDHPRPDTTLEGLAALRPAFRGDGCVTAGNASGIVDGAAATLVARPDVARGRGWGRLGRVRGWCVAGVEPQVMGIGPVPAVRGLLEATGVRLGDVALIEVNEAFAAQYLSVERELDLDRDRVNVNGGAIALGHPLGATGARLVLTLLRELRRRDGGLGIATACIGGGQGIAILVEAA